jgi:hypothetical protein
MKTEEVPDEYVVAFLESTPVAVTKWEFPERASGIDCERVLAQGFRAGFVKGRDSIKGKV